MGFGTYERIQDGVVLDVVTFERTIIIQKLSVMREDQFPLRCRRWWPRVSSRTRSSSTSRRDWPSGAFT